jgi:predicted Rossmann fold flavoprotein
VRTEPKKTLRPHKALFDLLIIGGGASGMVAAITAARRGESVVLCEKSPSLGRKLLASGGQRCNLSNTLNTDDFMDRWGRDGRFLGSALSELGGPKLRDFFHDIGVKTVVLDGFRVWPETRKSSTVLKGLEDELARLGVQIAVDCEVLATENDGEHFHVTHPGGVYRSRRLIIATGGLALPKSGANGGGYGFAESFGHRINSTSPAGVPLVSGEAWTARCTAHTIGKAHLQVALKKHAKIARTGDLIFTKQGIRGPVVLDISREIAPLLERYDNVPIVMNFCRGKDQEQWQRIFKDWRTGKNASITERMTEHLPLEVAQVLLELANVPVSTQVHTLQGGARDELIQILLKTPLTITGTTGYAGAFVTRGGVRLKEVNPDTLESKCQPGLYLCGEVLNLDGPCGGFNLQWAFASGYLAACGRGSVGSDVDRTADSIN